MQWLLPDRSLLKELQFIKSLKRARVDKRVFWPQYFRKIEYVCLIGFRLA